MRCYFMRDGHIKSVETLSATDDANRITESRRLFEAGRERLKVDGFEVWEGSRFVYRFPESAAQD